MLWKADKTGTNISLTQRWENYTGQTTTDTQNWGWLNAIHPDDLPLVEERFRNAFASGKGVEMEQRICSADGSYRWFQVQHHPMLDKTGQVTEWFGAAVDIHDRKLMEEALRKSEARYRSLFTSIDEGFMLGKIITDEAGTPVDYRILEVNPAYEKMTGLTKEAVTGKTVREVTPDIEEVWIKKVG